MAQYTAIVNKPGYLPDSESNTATFDTLDQARSWLAAEIDRDWDAAYEQVDESSGDDTLAQSERIDAVYLPAHTEVNHLQPGDSVTAGELVYEIQTT